MSAAERPGGGCVPETASQLLGLSLHALSPAAQDHIATLAQVAQALAVQDPSPAALAAAAQQAATQASQRQDEEEALYDFLKQLEAQTALAAAALQALTEALRRAEAVAPAQAAEAENDRRRANDNASKLGRYAAQQEQAAAQLAAAGFGPQIRHSAIQARSKEAAQAEAALAAARAALQQYAGLPADLQAARRAHQEQQQSLQALRERIRQGLECL